MAGQQATTLDRADASPVQVEAADALFKQQPLDHPDLLTKVDPAAACVSAAHWLTAAAVITASLAEISPANVFAESDNINACSIEIPKAVVTAIEEHDLSPREVVKHLLTAARQAAEGKIPSLDTILDQIADVQERVQALPEDQRDDIYRAYYRPAPRPWIHSGRPATCSNTSWTESDQPTRCFTPTSTMSAVRRQ